MTTTGSQMPQENHTAVTTSAEGHGATQRDLSGQKSAFPDVRLLPDGRVAWHLPHPGVPAGDLEWLTTDEKGRPTWYAERELPLDSQRLIPAGPLLDLVGDLDRLATDAASYSEESAVWVRSCADRLRNTLAPLLGELPEPQGETP